MLGRLFAHITLVNRSAPGFLQITSSEACPTGKFLSTSFIVSFISGSGGKTAGGIIGGMTGGITPGGTTGGITPGAGRGVGVGNGVLPPMRHGALADVEEESIGIVGEFDFETQQVR